MAAGQLLQRHVLPQARQDLHPSMRIVSDLTSTPTVHGETCGQRLFAAETAGAHEYAHTHKRTIECP